MAVLHWVGTAMQPHRMGSWELPRNDYGDNRRESVSVEGEKLAGRLGDEPTSGEPQAERGDGGDRAGEQEAQDQGEPHRLRVQVPAQRRSPGRAGTRISAAAGEFEAHVPKAGLTNHYRQAHRLLEAYQGKPQVELLCMLALTVGTTSDMIVYNIRIPSLGSISSSVLLLYIISYYHRLSPGD